MTKRPIQARFHFGFGFLFLNLATHIKSLIPSPKSTWSLALPLIVSIKFQGLFHSPPGVLFTFPSWYLFTIDLEYCLGLESGLPRFRPGYTSPILLRIQYIQIIIIILRGLHSLWLYFRITFSFNYNLYRVFSGYSHIIPTTPIMQRPALTHNRFDLFPFRSSLLRESHF